MTTRKKNTEGEGQPQVDPALQLIISQLQMIDANQKMLANHLGSLKEQTDQKFELFQKELIRDREAAAQGLKASMEAMMKSIEQTKMTKEDMEKAIAAARDEAMQSAAAKKARFQELLKDATTGTLVSMRPTAVPLQVQGVTYMIQPGVNLNVPQPFIDAWQDSEELNQIASERAALIAGSHNYGDLEDWRFAGRGYQE